MIHFLSDALFNAVIIGILRSESFPTEGLRIIIDSVQPGYGLY